MISYRGRLNRDLERWQAAGWISGQGHAAIVSDLASRRSGIGLSSALAVLAAVLIGFAAMSFVAANWDHMSKLARLALIGTGLVGSYAGAAWLFHRGLDVMGHAAVLAGVALFGAGIMLIAQMYHMDGHAPDAVWLWGVGALVSAVVLRSNPAIGAAIVLFLMWTFYELQFTTSVHWPYLPMWALTAFAVWLTRWRAGLQLISLALAVWIVAMGYKFGGDHNMTGHAVVTLIGVALVAVSMAFGATIDRWRRVSGPMLGYGMAIAFAGSMALQFVTRTDNSQLLALGALTLAALVGTLIWAWRTDNRPALWLAYTAFSIEVFALYVKKLGTLINTSLFFLIAGVLVAVLAATAYRLHQTPREGAVS